ncbi:MAG: uroporphyrinogen-III C-methyltransferase [Archaeoglobus sp.]|nr:uroporphyrinogen-III C-methyltransferase [Archaeoglobus sp.]
MSLKKGKVYLVGAGPGDPELLTLKALRAIEQADVILYDKLVGDRIISFLKEMGKNIIYVGKDSRESGGKKQKEINRLMKKFALQGKKVVRLKGGDPFVFGRGSIEARFLKDEGIEFEVIPGVSSVSGVPTHACVPLTHPDFSTALLVVSGREEVKKWSEVLLEGTIVILMGRDKIGDISEELIKLGRDPETPVAVIENGTLESERTIFSNLSDVSDLLKKNNVNGPAIIVVGDIVTMGEELRETKKG